MVYECCICFEAYDEVLDNNNATTCETCKNKICLSCYDKSTELRITNNKFDKLVNNCCICRTESEKINLNDFSKAQLKYLLIRAFERIHSSDLKMIEYEKKIADVEDANLRNSLDLVMVVERAKLIIANKKITKHDIKIRLENAVNCVGVF